MKKLIIISLFAISLVWVVSCGISSSKVNNPMGQAKAEKVVYTCEMHPEVVSDKPGKCPKCGMELIKKEVADSTQMHDMRQK